MTDGDYYTRAETDTAHQEIVDNMTMQLIEMRKALDKNLNEKLGTLMTKEDGEELKIFLRNMNIGVGFIKFSWNNSAKIGSLLMLILGIFLFFKLGAVGIFTYLFKK